jgi:O-antigen/teichoic acid export membrane protein
MNLKAKVVSGIKWSVISKLVVQVFSWTSTFLVLRILLPEDYAVMALLTIVTSFISLFALNGFSAVIIKEQNSNKYLESQVFTISLFIHVAYSVAMYLMSGFLGDFFDNQVLVDVVRVYAFILPINSLLIVPFARIDISMNFKVRAIVESISALFSSIVCLTLAYNDFSIWSLIWAQVVDMILKVILLSYYTKTIPKITTCFEGAKNWLRFLVRLQLNSLLWFSYSKFDSILIGRLIGMKELGIYNVGVQVASLPASKFSSIINQVGFTAFSSINDDLEKGKRYLTKSIRLAAFMLFPIFYGISSISEILVTLLIGDKWMTAAPIIAIFSFIFPLRMINTIIQNYLNSIDLAGFNLQNTLLTFFILIISIFSGSYFGVLGVATAWLIGYSFSFIIILIRTSIIAKINYKLLFSWVPAFLVSLLMWVILYAFEIDMSNLFIALLLKVIFGGIIILLAYGLFFKNEIKALLDLKRE